MRNITALTVLGIIIFISFTINPAYSEDEKKYNFSVGWQTGFVYGRAVEIVYPIPGENRNEFYSELLWDMKPVFYIGAQIDFSRAVSKRDPRFFSSLSFKGGIPGDSGKIEDRDWISDVKSEPTHFSSHTNKTLNFLWLDAVIGVGASLPKLPDFYIKQFISFSWMHFSFSGRDGSGTHYGVNVSWSGEVIRYKQDWLLIGGGFSAGTRILNPFNFEVSLRISPFTYCSATDEHLALGKVVNEYRDFSSFGLIFEPECVISYSIRQFDFSLVFSYRYIGRTSGNSYTNESNTGFYLSEKKAGAGLSVFDTRLLFKLHLGK
jgi:outer membrane protease